jgi:DnaJ-domain-containing protein 1
VQKAAEDAFAANQSDVETKALKLHSENPAKAVAMLTKYTAEMAESTMKAWGDLAKFLIVKHNDLVVKPTEDNGILGTFKRTETGLGASPIRPGYPEDFNRRVIKETGDRYLIK